MLCSCSSSIKVDIRGKLSDNAASEVYLVVEDTQIDTLAHATVRADNTFHLRGEVAEPRTAFICDDNGNALAMFLTEEADLQLKPQLPSGYLVEGGPINDKYNLTMRQLSDLARQIMNIDQNSETAEEEYESLMARYHDILSTTITDNLDNIVGVELFLAQESNGMSAQDMRVRMAQFSEQMRNLAPMKQFAEYIEQYARTEVGQPFIDMELHTTTGGKQFSEVCKGKWVLLDFWATWCEPCLTEMPTLIQAYEKYAIRGLEICAVSLDMDPERWRAFITENNLLWTNAIDMPAEGEPTAVEIYGLQTIPANFLISPQGEIVAKNLYGENLLHELAHRLGE
jgi:thiol-disulfide isomerase/thioredoxin